MVSRHSRRKHWFLLCLALALFSPANAGLVKRSNSGLCHPPESAWYERTKNYQAFDSLATCLQSGGRLPSGIDARGSRRANNTSQVLDYERSAFGHGWSDTNRDCQNSRAEALIAASTTTARFASDKGCRVVSGRWISPFTQQVIQNASDIDIDHVVPLKWAWQRGASGWPLGKRESFANDMTNLWPVKLGLNRSKSAQGPDEWLPPSGHCGYVARFQRIVKQYDLEPSAPEASWIQVFLDRCRS
jgi:hypothetical protein